MDDLLHVDDAPMSDAELTQEVEAQRNLMVSVATGGARIDEVNREYTARRRRIQKELRRRSLSDPNPYDDLWRWYAKWKADLGGYQSRREFVADLYGPLLDELSLRSSVTPHLTVDPTGWVRVDRDIADLPTRVGAARSEAQFQAVGLLCREILISLAQAVYKPERHNLSGMEIGTTDAKRMLEGYISVEFAGSNESLRRYARSALDVSNDLQHRRTATFRDAAACAEATRSVVNLVAIISGRRDPVEGQ